MPQTSSPAETPTEDLKQQVLHALFVFRRAGVPYVVRGGRKIPCKWDVVPEVVLRCWLDVPREILKETMADLIDLGFVEAHKQTIKVPHSDPTSASFGPLTVEGARSFSILTPHGKRFRIVFGSLAGMDVVKASDSDSAEVDLLPGDGRMDAEGVLCYSATVEGNRWYKGIPKLRPNALRESVPGDTVTLPKGRTADSGTGEGDQDREFSLDFPDLQILHAINRHTMSGGTGITDTVLQQDTDRGRKAIRRIRRNALEPRGLIMCPEGRKHGRVTTKRGRVYCEEHPL